MNETSLLPATGSNWRSPASPIRKARARAPASPFMPRQRAPPPTPPMRAPRSASRSARSTAPSSASRICSTSPANRRAPARKCWPTKASRRAADAPIVRRLRAGGAVIVAKTNMTEFAYSGIGANPHFGTPGNPADRARVPGGSSSGAAVAAADGMCEIAIGSDTGGSVRIPAALCGIVGFKPSRAARADRRRISA